VLGTSRRSFLKSSRTSQPIREEEEEEEEEEYLGGMAFSDEGRQQGVLSTVIQEEGESARAAVFLLAFYFLLWVKS